MTYGEALDALHSGQTVTRCGWPEKGAWLQLGKLPGSIHKCKADGRLVMWLASPADTQADDWAVAD